MHRLSSPPLAFRHIPELDGIRGIAILLVMVMHFGAFEPTDPGLAHRVFRSFVDFGWIGVDLFFVLSGFLITGILLDAKGSPHYFKSFYMRRILRILPLYYLSVFTVFWIIIPVAGILFPASNVIAGAKQLSPLEQLWYWLHVSNWRIGFGVSPPLLGHFWSLAIEEQFYIFWPLVVLRCSESTLLRVCACGIAVSVALRNVPLFHEIQSANPSFFYCLTPFRLETILIGGCIAVMRRRPCFQQNSLRFAAAAAALGGFSLWPVITLGGVAVDSVPMARFGYTAIALVGASFVIYAIAHSGSQNPVTRILRTRLLTNCGKYSYGMYILHAGPAAVSPILSAEAAPYIGEAGASLITIAAGAIITYGLGICSWKLLETPFLRLKDRFPYAPGVHRKAPPEALGELAITHRAEP